MYNELYNLLFTGGSCVLVFFKVEAIFSLNVSSVIQKITNNKGEMNNSPWCLSNIFFI